jgi:hypothetical protein
MRGRPSLATRGRGNQGDVTEVEAFCACDGDPANRFHIDECLYQTLALSLTATFRPICVLVPIAYASILSVLSSAEITGTAAARSSATTRLLEPNFLAAECCILRIVVISNPSVLPGADGKKSDSIVRVQHEVA